MAMTFLVCALAVLTAGTASANEPDFRAVDEAVRIVLSAGDAPGVVVLIGQGERVLYRRAFGARSLVPKREPMTEDTVFVVASLT